MGGKWGLYPWFIEHGADLIHPEDFAAFQRIASNVTVFECVGVGEYLTIRYGQERYRVKDKLFYPVPPPRFDFGQKVLIRDKNMEAFIKDILWHYNREEHYYLLRQCVNGAAGKKLKKRYFSLDLFSEDSGLSLHVSDRMIK